MSDLFSAAYNPDVLSCLANLSNDEVFTPPELANQILDLLPEEIWRDPNATFLDPACKSGVFLREIAKRLTVGLEEEIPELQERIEHIFRYQIFGIATTELCSLLSRRSTYCSKYPSSKYSVVRFDNPEGNVRYKNKTHTWVGEKCKHCGAPKREYERGDALEAYAYEFIHCENIEELLPMKFDVIVSNPPYQLETGGSGRQAKPIYHLFVEQAKKLNPRFMSMIIQSRWFAGGMGMDDFRQEMMSDSHITRIVDYANAKECFPQNSVSGGVCYFLRERDREAECCFVNMSKGHANEATRSLNEFPVLVRYNDAVSVIRKVNQHNESKLTEIVSPISPFGLPTNTRGNAEKDSKHPVRLFSSAGYSYISNDESLSKNELFGVYKVALSQTGAEHACEPDKSGMFRVLTSSMRVLEPGDVCTHSYLALGPVGSRSEAENLLSYLKTRFVRFLTLQAVSSIHISKKTFCFVPRQDFSKAWSDIELYEKYGLSAEEIDFIESMIKPMED